MTDTAGPFDGTPWAEAQWARHAAQWAPSGVYGTPATSTTTGDLPLSVSGLSVGLGAGRAWVRGFGFERTGGAVMQPVTANTHASFFRQDRIVLRRNLATHTLTPVLLTGTPAGSPSAPPLTQSETGSWDLPLFSFLVPPNSGTSISGLVDERPLVTDATLSRLRITSTGDASETSTGHGFQIGPDDGLNLIIDNNEIIARDNGAVSFIGLNGTRLVSVGAPTAAADAATKGYVDGEVFQNAGNLGAIVGSIPSAGTPLLIKTIKKQVVTNGSGVGAAAFPGGSFPNAVLTAHVTTATDEPFFWVVHSLSNTLAQVNLLAYNITTGTVAGGLSIATAITVIGW